MSVKLSSFERAANRLLDGTKSDRDLAGELERDTLNWMLRENDLRAQRDALAEVLRRTVEAVEACLPSGDESVGCPEFPSMKLSEVWSRREAARAALAVVAKP